MRKLLGIHSTSRSSAAHILEQGFKPSPLGRVGTGVYFWHYWHDDSYARHLALTWWRRNYKQGMFQEQDNPLAALLYVSVDVAEDSVFDMLHGVARERVQNLLNQQVAKVQLELAMIAQHRQLSKRDRDTYMDITVNRFYENYFRNTNTKVVLANVPTPRGFIGDIGKFFSSGEVLLVLPQQLKDIRILACEEVEE